MNISRKFLVVILAAAGIAMHAAVVYAAVPKSMTVNEVLSIKPCLPQQFVKIEAYMQSSRHGAWISKAPGTNSKGIPLEISDKLDRQKNSVLFNFLYDPKIYSNNLFHATFSGSISCNGKGVPVLKPSIIESIKITAVKDAK